MNAATIVSIMKPNITSLGYGLFLAINAAGVWGGVFPFLPMEFQTTEIVFWFFLAQSLVFSFSYFASALGSYFFPGPTRTFIVRLATMPYLLGWCCLIAAIYLDAWALPLVVGGGAKGKVWRQMMADIYDARIKTPALLEEGASMGAAVVGGVGAGLFEGFEAIDRFVRVESIEEPNPEAVQAYKPVREMFEACYAAMVPLYQKMAGK